MRFLFGWDRRFPERRELGHGSQRELDRSGSWKAHDRGEVSAPDSGAVLAFEESQQASWRSLRELRAECKRWRNQAAAVERSRSTWRKHASAHEARAQEDGAARAKLESQLQQLREQSERRRSGISRVARRLAALEGAEKKGVVNRLADCTRERIRGPWAGPVDMPPERSTTVDLAWQSTANQSASHRSWGRRSLRTPPRPSAASKFPYRYQPGSSSGVSGGWPLAGLVCCTGDADW